MKMSEEVHGNEALGLDDLHEEVTELDGKIAAATKDEMSDSETAELNDLIEQRNQAYKRHHTESVAG
jgi:hypothetical protein